MQDAVNAVNSERVIVKIINKTDVTADELGYILSPLNNVSPDNIKFYNNYIDKVTVDANVLIDLQKMVNDVNNSVDGLKAIITNINSEHTSTLINDLKKIWTVAADKVIDDNLAFYEAYIKDNTNLFKLDDGNFDNVDSMLTSVNPSVLALNKIDTELSDITVNDLNNIWPSLTNIKAKNLAIYKAYIESNKSSQATRAEVLEALTKVNLSSTVLVKIGQNDTSPYLFSDV